jgi:hypothetical protein
MKLSKPLITLLILSIAVALIGSANAFEYETYETVGGEISQTNFITVFLAPTLVAISIFGAIILLGVIRARSKTETEATM